MGPILPNDIISIANKFKSKLSQGHDNISMKFTKQIINDIAEPLAYIFNLSLTNGTVPRDLKIAKIVPIFKTGDQELFNNY